MEFSFSRCAGPKQWECNHSYEEGLCVQGIDGPTFARHFKVRTDLMREFMGLGPSSSADMQERAEQFQAIQHRPECWGLRARYYKLVWDYIGDDLTGYAAAHEIDEECNHVCLVNPCGWKHYGKEPVLKEHAKGQLSRMKADMHLVVQRYLRPWTEGLKGSFATALNAGCWAAIGDGRDVETLCKAQVFISHTWGENFEEFAATISNFLHSETVSWVCSFALDQNSDIASSLKDVEQCPFARAMAAIPKVLVVTDETAEALQRCWVVLEAELARKWNKQYGITLADNSRLDRWQAAFEKLSVIDVRQCKASCKEDKDAILEYAERNQGGIEELNKRVRDLATVAMRHSEIMAIGFSGEVARLPATQDLINWRSQKGGTLAHVCVKKSRIKAFMEIMNRTNKLHLNAIDRLGRTPLHVAVEYNSLASVQMLVGLKALVDVKSRHGFTPLHSACVGKFIPIAKVLLQARADIEAVAMYTGCGGHRPLTIAATTGSPPLVYFLAKSKADWSKRTDAGGHAVSLAAKFGNPDSLAVLLGLKAEVDLECGKDPGRTALLEAVRWGQMSVVGMLVAGRANINACSERRGTVEDCYMNCMKYFPERGTGIKWLMLNNGYVPPSSRSVEGDVPFMLESVEYVEQESWGRSPASNETAKPSVSLLSCWRPLLGKACAIQ